MRNDLDLVARHREVRVRTGQCSRALAWTVSGLMLWLSGCGAVKQDVHRYYRQMAQNYQEAAEKAKFQAATLEAESRSSLATGNIHRYNRTRKELSRIKDWEERCMAQRERFEKAARTLEPVPRAEPGTNPRPDTQAATEPDPTPPAG